MHRVPWDEGGGEEKKVKKSSPGMTPGIRKCNQLIAELDGSNMKIRSLLLSGDDCEP